MSGLCLVYELIMCFSWCFIFLSVLYCSILKVCASLILFVRALLGWLVGVSDWTLYRVVSVSLPRFNDLFGTVHFSVLGGSLVLGFLMSRRWCSRS